MARLGSAAVLLLLRASSASRAQVELHGRSAECGPGVAVPPGGQPLREYFDDKRASFGITSPSGGTVDPETCTKKDICLLMRQLDMDFYERAREGLLTESDYASPPTYSWHAADNCNSLSRGYKETTVTDSAKCLRMAKRKGAKGELEVVSDEALPSGCVISVNRATGRTAAYMNDIESSATAGSSYRGKNRIPTRIMQLCVMDRSLSESGAAYYSPYKLKPSMEGREGHSTACSFGMMAALSRVSKTGSPCAKILTYTTDTRFHSAEHALQMAEAMEARGPQFEAMAAKIRAYVDRVRAKFVLLDTIANEWCPGVWTAAKASDGATCDVPRVMAWTEDNKGDLFAIAKQLGQEDVLASGLTENEDSNEGRTDSYDKPLKYALNDASCEAFEDETLAARLEGAPPTPPDFFEHAFMLQD